MDQVLSHDRRRKKYRVKWLGYGHENDYLGAKKDFKIAIVQVYWV